MDFKTEVNLLLIRNSIRTDRKGVLHIGLRQIQSPVECRGWLFPLGRQSGSSSEPDGRPYWCLYRLPARLTSFPRSSTKH